MAEKKLGEFATPNNDYLRTPITQPAIAAEDYEIKPHYLSLVQQNQFGGSAVEDAGMHLNTFTEIDRKSTRLNSSHSGESRMPSSA